MQFSRPGESLDLDVFLGEFLPLSVLGSGFICNGLHCHGDVLSGENSHSLLSGELLSGENNRLISSSLSKSFSFSIQMKKLVILGCQCSSSCSFFYVSIAENSQVLKLVCLKRRSCVKCNLLVT